MQINYKLVQSREKPIEIDGTSSENGYFVRRNIKEILKEDENSKEQYTLYEYQEAFLNHNEYEIYSKDLLVQEINGEENTKEFETYVNKLKTPVLYTNGKYYKPSWIPLYSSIMDEFNAKIQLYEKAGGDVAPFLAIKTNIYDATGKEENVEQMTIKQIIELWLFLYRVKEQYYKEYRESLMNLNI